MQSFETYQNLSVMQFSVFEFNKFDFISGVKAVDNNYLKMNEVDISGNVNEIYISNDSKFYILLTDGDILKGAKQNRVFNTSVFLEPYLKYKIPVSCVESGRWSFDSPKFTKSDYSAPVSMRKRKSEAVFRNLEKCQKYQADQSDVWNCVSYLSKRNVVNSETSDLDDVFEARRIDFRDFINSFSPLKNANGLAIFSGEKLLNIEVFGRTGVYADYFPQILKSVSVERFDIDDKSLKIPEDYAEMTVQRLLYQIGEMEHQIYPGAAAGVEKRFKNPKVSGFELNYNNYLIHLSLFYLN